VSQSFLRVEANGLETKVIAWMTATNGPFEERR
jgi:hypothetical protein